MSGAIIFIICILTVVTFINLKEISPVTKLLFYFVTSTVLKEGFSILEVNLGYIKRDYAYEKALILSLYSVAFNPVLISLVLLKIWKEKMKNYYKILILFGLILILTGCDYMLTLLGYVHFIKWNLYLSAIRYSINIILLLLLLTWFNKKVMKI